MRGGIERLSARRIATEKKPGLHADGGGLYLRVTATGTRSWIFRYRSGARQHDIGLGPYPAIGLADARERARAQQRLRVDGHDPLKAKRAQQAAAVPVVTFEEAAYQFLDRREPGWKVSGKSFEQWHQSLRDYVFPIIGPMPVREIDRGAVLRCIEPIWTAKPTVAGRVRNRIERVLDYAKAKGLRDGDNPAAWKGGLEHVLPAPRKLADVVHYTALPYQRIGEVMVALGACDEPGTRALELVVLTACRPGEVLGATWPEFDLGARLWTIPAARMKGGREHRVPLSDAAIAVLEKLPRDCDTLFPGIKGYEMVRLLQRVLKPVRLDKVTSHGMRSSFSTWASERTNFSFEVREHSLAHQVGGVVERSYSRTTLFEQRRQLMQQWADYCANPETGDGAKVVPLRGATA